eukprot:c12189_g1_i1.p1 GENE.c12189_g1_i1~~c12189_g1_i1.p1  ORF type:complete len:113 (+),score=10.33 c12189_g1_i1:183-521(+)
MVGSSQTDASVRSSLFNRGRSASVVAMDHDIFAPKPLSQLSQGTLCTPSDHLHDAWASQVHFSSFESCFANEQTFVQSQEDNMPPTPDHPRKRPKSDFYEVCAVRSCSRHFC